MQAQAAGYRSYITELAKLLVAIDKVGSLEGASQQHHQAACRLDAIITERVRSGALLALPGGHGLTDFGCVRSAP